MLFPFAETNLHYVAQNDLELMILCLNILSVHHCILYMDNSAPATASCIRFGGVQAGWGDRGRAARYDTGLVSVMCVLSSWAAYGTSV